MRDRPEDFAVDEQLGFQPTGEGEHLFLRVEKRGLNTITVAGALAEAAGVDPAAVGYAGLKDRRAVTRQWFSVATPRCHLELPADLDAAVLTQTRHARKLRRGQIARNAFCIRLRGVQGAADEIEARLVVLRDDGAPNYFGVQRFGRKGGNLDAAWIWLSRRPRRRLSAFKRGLYISAARSLLFNAVLAERVRRGNWNVIIEGDPLDQGRPTGPLWGRGRSAAQDASAVLEAEALAPLGQWLEPLEHIGLAQQRRVLALLPENLIWQWEQEQTVLRLEFALCSGSYATSVVEELGHFAVASGQFDNG
jgi:tRNA pseudouridine13 synthase